MAETEKRSIAELSQEEILQTYKRTILERLLGQPSSELIKAVLLEGAKDFLFERAAESCHTEIADGAESHPLDTDEVLRKISALLSNPEDWEPLAENLDQYHNLVPFPEKITAEVGA